MRKVIALLLFVGAAPLAAMYMIGDIVDVPVERLAANLERLIQQEPNTFYLRLNLGRLYAMAYALNKTELPAQKDNERTGAYDGYPPKPRLPAPPTPESRNKDDNKQRRANLDKAIAAYRQALAVNPRDTTANLGIGWCLEQSADRGGAISAYRRTIELDNPATIGHAAMSATEEAAQYLIPLLDVSADKAEIDQLRARIKTINATTGRAITPIAIPLREQLSADDLLNDGAAVAFDADGSGIRKRWTWINADAGWLVYDRRNSGKVTSALQLFGNVTWWLFWQSGYDALRGLDDNFDRTISGRELDGLAIWRDQNGDGLSQPGEVQPLSYWRIVALSYDHQRDPRSLDGMVYSPRGVTFEDGSTRPTFDLILHQRPTS